MSHRIRDDDRGDVCPVCAQVFDTQALLLTHLIEEHDRDALLEVIDP